VAAWARASGQEAVQVLPSAPVVVAFSNGREAPETGQQVPWAASIADKRSTARAHVAASK
jgi:hypothetical protein